MSTFWHERLVQDSSNDAHKAAQTWRPGGVWKLLKFVTRFIFPGLNVILTEGSLTRGLVVNLTVTIRRLRLSNRRREEGGCALTDYGNYWTYVTPNTSGVKSVPEEGFTFLGLTCRLRCWCPASSLWGAGFKSRLFSWFFSVYPGRCWDVISAQAKPLRDKLSFDAIGL
jgi:hypothetical protein